MSVDLLGRDLTGDEEQLIDVYGRLKALAGRDDLAPCVTANVRAALAAVGNAVNDLGLDYEHLLDLGV